MASSSSTNGADATAIEVVGSSNQSFGGYVACDAVILALCTLLLALQLFVRLVKIRGSLLPHHCFSMLAWCFVVVGLSGDLHRIHQAQKVQTTVVNVMENPQNAVRDLSNLVTWGVSIAKWTYAAPMMYYSAMWSIKAALVAAAFNHRRYMAMTGKLAVYVTAAYLGCTYIILMFSQAFWCAPTKNWTAESQLCAPSMSMGFTVLSFVLSATTDLSIVALMMFLLTRLQLSSRERIALVPVVGLGLFSLAATAVRFSAGVRVVDELSGARDTRSASHVTLWSALEIGGAFAAAVLPSLRGLCPRALQSTIEPAAGRRTPFAAGRAPVSSATYTKEEPDAHLVSLGSKSELSYGPDGSRPQTAIPQHAGWRIHPAGQV